MWADAQDLHKLGVQEGDLLHMDNTVQMHKPVPQASRWRSVVFVHDHWKQRLYYLPTEETGVKERLRAKQARGRPATLKACANPEAHAYFEERELVWRLP